MLNSFSAVTWLWWQWGPECVTASVPAPVDGGAVDAFARAHPIGQFGITSGGWGIRVTEFNPRETILISETTSESKCCLAVCWQMGCWPCRNAVAGDKLQCVTCSEVWPAHTCTCWIFHTECIQSSVFSKRIPNALHQNFGPEGVNSVKSC